MGLPPELDGVLPFWLGAWAIQLTPEWLSPVMASRLPFMAIAASCLAMTWYAIEALARSPQAQPVSFAFGGEAEPKAYARTLADAGLLALIACLGLAVPLHETSPMLVQLGGSSALFMGVALLRTHPWRGGLISVLGLSVLALSGAPTLAMALGLAALLVLMGGTPELSATMRLALASLLGLALLLLAGMVNEWDLWRWRLRTWPLPASEIRRWLELMLWFTWPCWPLALWSAWSWRRQWGRRPWSMHVIWPITMIVTVTVASAMTAASERTLLLALPALAAMAAFALPTLQRSVTALIDWFTLLFFTGCGVVIWVVWLAMQTGWPPQPAANVARLAPGFIPAFEYLPLALAWFSPVGLAGALAGGPAPNGLVEKPGVALGRCRLVLAAVDDPVAAFVELRPQLCALGGTSETGHPRDRLRGHPGLERRPNCRLEVAWPLALGKPVCGQSVRMVVGGLAMGQRPRARPRPPAMDPSSKSTKAHARL